MPILPLLTGLLPGGIFMPYYYYGFDYTYLVFVLPALLIALVAQIKVKTTFRKYAKVMNARGLSGAEVAAKILSSNGVLDVAVQRVSGNLTDHFDPTARVIRLSQSVYDSHSVAAVGVAAHEAGHALQYAEDYFPIRLRAAIIPITKVGSALSWPLIILGLVFSFGFLVNLGIILFSAVTLFQLVTLPVEFNASRRALNILQQQGILAPEELGGARKVLTAAAMTYVAALLVSVMQLLRLIALFSNRRD